MTATDPSAGYRVLLVEDEYFLAQELLEVFQSRGAEVVGPVPSVDEALDLITATPRLDGAVLDINLQGEMVYTVADALEARGVPFVFATGYDQEAIPKRYAQAQFFGKPLVAAQVAEALLA